MLQCVYINNDDLKGYVMKFIKFSILVNALFLLMAFFHIPTKGLHIVNWILGASMWALAILFYYACFLKACDLLRFGGKMLGFQLVEKPKPIEKPIVQSFSYKAGRKIGAWLRH